MLNAAIKIPNIEWHLGSATELPFGDSSFEVVLCQQGLQFFPDRAAALKEISRVLVPGGMPSLNVWGRLDRQLFDVIYWDCGIVLALSSGPKPQLPTSWVFP